MGVDGNIQAIKEYLNRQIGGYESLNILDLDNNKKVVGFQIINPDNK